MNSPQAVADKMSDAFWLFEGDMLAALRHVFIEKQEPVSARLQLQAAQQREAEAMLDRDEAIREVLRLALKYGEAHITGDTALATQPKGETT